MDNKFARLPGQSAPSLEDLNYDANGLIPCVVTHADTGRALMLAFVNREALGKTIVSGRMHFWSRSRQCIWLKGETSGNYLDVVRLHLDCDADALWAQVRPAGPACHTGEPSCFFTELYASPGEPTPRIQSAEFMQMLIELLAARNVERPEGSYTAKLFEGGRDRILKKIGEESGEVIIAAKNQNVDELRWELADLLFHALVLCVNEKLDPHAVIAELQSRRH